MDIHVACSLYKLACATYYLHCYEHFTIRKSIVHLVVYEFVGAVNLFLNNQLKWLKGNDLIEVVDEFKDFCGCY
jgi:hypothetical protein